MSFNLYAIGVGGAGCNMITRLTLRKGTDNSIKTIALNTDARHLQMVKADKKVLLKTGSLYGHGAGGKAEVGEMAMQQSIDRVMPNIQDPHIVFIAAGMGGGTGTGGAPVLAKYIKSQYPDAIVIGVVTYPFQIERSRLKVARKGIYKMLEHVDTLILIDNNKLLEYNPNLPLNEAFALADDVMIRAIKGIADTLSRSSLINIDYADLKALMSKGGLAMISLGEGHGPERVYKAIETTLNHPLVEVDYEGAKGALVHLESDDSLTVDEAMKIAGELTKGISEEGEVKLGLRINPEMHERINVTLITVGVKSPQLLGHETLEQHLREIGDKDMLDMLESV
ncbi:MAG: cell division protein FtsZ [Candidatus Micrarchaeota archaeon]|nr:cell division protein FtsZ [Candidatus Micrarchaeota archaeon]